MSDTATRFAPSPTGLIHLGNLRTAFFNWLLARRQGGRFVLRVEDTDAERSRPEYVEALMEDLQWLGLDWDEGPAVGGAHGPYFQAERSAIYAQYYARLEQAECAYRCYCTPEQLALSRKTQRSAGQAPRYAGTCRGLSPKQRAAFDAEGRRPTLRFRVEGGKEIRFVDLVRGPQRFASDDIGDFVIRRADGTAAFFFGNALDDALMGITHVLRGEDHLANTPRQILLLERLGLPLPQYGHISLLVAADGAPLSKRKGAPGVRRLREEGYLAEALLNYLLRLGHTPSCEGWLSRSGMPDVFDTGRLGRAPARFDTDQLEHWQRESVLHAALEELAEWVGAEALARVPARERDRFLTAVRPNVLRPAEAAEWARLVYGPRPELSAAAVAAVDQAGPDFFAQAEGAFVEHGHDLEALAAALGERTGRRGKALYMPLRAALTGQTHGPELGPLLRLMPTVTVAERLRGLASAAKGGAPAC